MTWKPDGKSRLKRVLSPHEEMMREMRLQRALLASIAGMTPKTSRHTQHTPSSDVNWICSKCKSKKGSDSLTGNTIATIDVDKDIAATVEMLPKRSPSAIKVNTGVTTELQDETVDLDAASASLSVEPTAWSDVPLTSPLAKRVCTSLSDSTAEPSSSSAVPVAKVTTMETKKRSAFSKLFSNIISTTRIGEILDILEFTPDAEGLAWNIARLHYSKFLRNKKEIPKRCVCFVCSTHIVDKEKPILKWTKFGIKPDMEHLIQELSPYRTIPLQDAPV
jgi:hypothetical protein